MRLYWIKHTLAEAVLIGHQNSIKDIKCDERFGFHPGAWGP